MTQAEELALFPEDVVRPQGVQDVELVPEVVPALDRLRIMQLEEGFSPSTRGELNEAYSLKAFIGTPGGTAKHLAEVARHQTKYGADPTKTATSITRDYILYAGGARTDLTMLTTLQEELHEMRDENPLAAVNRELIATGLGQLVRYKDLRELAESKDFTRFPFSPLRPYSNKLPRTYDPYVQPTPNPQVQERIDAVLATTRVWEAKREVASAIEEQRQRHAFWLARLHEVEKGQTGIVRTVARTALERLGAFPELTG